MTLEDLTRPNLVTLAGLGLLSLTLPRLVPQMQPALKSAIRVGIALFSEAEAEAEGELIQSLIAATLDNIRQALDEPAGDREKRAAVQRSIRHFKHQARRRAHRWGHDDHGRHRCYDRHVAGLETALAQHKAQLAPNQRDVIEDAFVALADAD